MKQLIEIPTKGGVLLTLVVALGIAACSSCSSGNSHTDPDKGPSDLDTDTDNDGDSDTDTDTDTDTDASTTSDAGPWEWVNLPDSGDCGVTGCTQLSFTDEVRMLEWDVWEDWLVYADGDFVIHVVDLENNKQLTIPDPYTQGSSNVASAHPAIYQKKIYYTYAYGAISPPVGKMITADVQSESQQVLWEEEKLEEDFPGCSHIDVWGAHLVCKGNFLDISQLRLLHFSLPTTTTPEIVDGHGYGSHNSIWEDVVVWYTPDSADYDVR